MKLVGDNWLRNIQIWLFPARCLLCDGPGQTAPLLDLCAFCQADLPRLSDPVHVISKPPPGSTAIDGLVTPYRYEYPLNRMISALKYRDALSVARLLGSLLALEVAQNDSAHRSRPDVLVPVPLHANRLRARGFNQALEIAKPISKLLGIPIDARVCVRTMDTPSQTGLSAAQRKDNLIDAFAVRVRDVPHSVVIIDDVYTTGSTVHSIACRLKEHGAKIVYAWCVSQARLASSRNS